MSASPDSPEAIAVESVIAGSHAAEAPAAAAANDHATTDKASQKFGKEQRFLLIDGLRGLAACGVAACHFIETDVFADAYRRWTPWPIYRAFYCGYLGVEVFFVISGFVIAYSMRGQRITAPYVARFAVRRSLRLDPVYWFTIACVLALNTVTARYFADAVPGSRDFPGIGAVLANVFYLQGILQIPFIVAQSWTLCMEIQFYLVFAVLLGLCQRWSPSAPRRVLGFPSAVSAVIMIPLFITSLALLLVPTFLNGALFISCWNLFFLGVLVWWALDGEIAAAWVWVGVALELLFGMLSHVIGAANKASDAPEIFIATAATAILIFVAGRWNKLSVWSGGAVFQFLGRISYSLYLGQALFGQKVIKIGARLTGTSPFSAYFWFLAGFAVTIGTATLMYYFIERPMMKLSRKLKDRRHPPSVAELTAPAPRPAPNVA